MSQHLPASAKDWLSLPEVLLPEVASELAEGTTYEVRKVGFLGVPQSSCPAALLGAQAVGDKVLLPTVTAVVNGDALLCRLALELSPWALSCVEMAHAGHNPFPSKVEFGRMNGRAYAEIL